MKAHRLLVAVLLTLIPSAQAQPYNETVTWRLDADQLEIATDVSLSGTMAADYRARIDQNAGNRDGTVTADEVEAYNRATRRTYTRDQPGCFDNFEFLRLDGGGPLRVSSMSWQASGAEGPTSSEAVMRHRFFMAFAYTAPASDRPTATMRKDDPEFYSSVRCATGRTIGGNGEEFAQAEGSRSIFLIHPLGEATIVRDSVRPLEAQEFWDGQGFRQDSAAAEPPVFPETITFTIHDPAVSGGAGTVEDVGTVLGYAVAGAAGLFGVALLFTEYGRYQVFKLLFLIPGFTRLEKDEVLEHSKREELYNFIKTNPGPSFSDLRRTLELSNGTLVHHLRILEAQEYVTGRRDGFRTRFYIRGPKIVPTSYLTRTQKQILDVIAAKPGLTQKELGAVLGLPRQSLFYHTKQLASQGKLDIRRQGNRATYWLRPGTPASAPSGAARPT